MQEQRVAVLGGGRSSEHEISLASAASVAEGLQSAGYRVRRIEVGRDGVWREEGRELSLKPGRGVEGVDVVFLALHGPFGEDGTVQGLLECIGVPYVGAGVLASALCMDKVMFKDVMGHAGIPQVRYRPVAESDYRAHPEGQLSALSALGLPVFVKPARLGSSVGIVRVGEAGELAGALEEAFEHDPLAIVEAAARGLEVECSVIGNGDPLASQPGEIVLRREEGWYDYEAKYSPGGMELVVPARISERLRDRVRELAVRTFRAAGCRGFARVDFFVEDDDRVLVNELNTIPGFTQTSVFGALFEASGIPYPELLHRLVRLGLERYEDERRHKY